MLSCRKIKLLCMTDHTKQLLQVKPLTINTSNQKLGTYYQLIVWYMFDDYIFSDTIQGPPLDFLSKKTNEKKKTVYISNPPSPSTPSLLTVTPGSILLNR